jgi:hypothetical protein
MAMYEAREYLIRQSSLIVDGRVIAVLPSVRLKPTFSMQAVSPRIDYRGSVRD